MSVTIVVKRHIWNEGTFSKTFTVEDGLEKAIKYDNYLKRRQDKAVKRHYRELKPSKKSPERSQTSILSIRVGWSVQWSKSQQRYNYFPKFNLSPYVNSKQFVTSVHILEGETIKDGWWRAIDKYAELRGLSGKERGALKRRKPPTSEQFDQVRLHLNHNYGYKIPKRKLPSD